MKSFVYTVEKLLSEKLMRRVILLHFVNKLLKMNLNKSGKHENEERK